VVEYTEISALPNSPSYIKGIIDLDDTITRKKVGIMVDDVLSISTFEINQVGRTGAADTDDDSCTLRIIMKKIQVKDRDLTDLIIRIDIRQLLEEIMKK
jgi:purine-binding chemotaxis protein CheW